MEHFDKETEFVVCVSVSRKGQIRTKSLTHNLRGNELVPYLFAHNLLRTTHRAATHTFCCSILLSFCDLLWFIVKYQNSNNNKKNTAKAAVLGRNIKQLLVQYILFHYVYIFCFVGIQLLKQTQYNELLLEISPATHLQMQNRSNIFYDQDVAIWTVTITRRLIGAKGGDV